VVDDDASNTAASRPAFGRRVAAAIALLAPLGILAVIGAGLWNHGVWLIVAVALVVVGIVAAWVGVTRHGLTRAICGLVSFASAAGVVSVLSGEGRGFLWLASLVLLIVVYGVAARWAVRPHVEEAHHRILDDDIAPARKGVLIINLKSGGGKAERFDLAREARDRGIEPVILTPGDDLLQLAEDAIARGADVLGMAGGDGSQALVATVAMQHDVPHVCIPAGTRNHFALDLGLDRDDVVGALDAFTDARERRVDLGQVNDRIFVNNASLGVYAKVVQSEEYRDAKLETWARMLPELLGPGSAPIDLAFTAGDGTTYDDAPLILVSNNPYQLTRLAGAGTRERIDTGTLGIVAARIRSAADVAQLVTLELAGQASRFPGLLAWTADEFDVRSGAPIEVGLDGEALVMDAPLRFTSLPGALRVRIPAHAPGISPAAAAVAMTAPNLKNLARIAVGRPPNVAATPAVDEVG
jgi:diacylglycerol kinase family enzyme